MTSNTTTPIVFVADGDSAVRESVKTMVQQSGWKAETFESAQDFLARPPARVPSCLIMDVMLRDLSGLDLQKRVAADRPEMPVIFITACSDVRISVQAMKAGAIEFLTKPYRNEVLAGAIRHALESSRRALERDASLKALQARHASLTPREREVMALVVSGLLNKQAAGELGISEPTVKAHRGQVMRKMQADSLAELVTMTARLGVAPPQAMSV